MIHEIERMVPYEWQSRTKDPVGIERAMLSDMRHSLAAHIIDNTAEREEGRYGVTLRFRRRVYTEDEFQLAVDYEIRKRARA
jgi:hypothetical protein